MSSYKEHALVLIVNYCAKRSEFCLLSLELYRISDAIRGKKG
jgi:hypothetical protein